MQGTNAHAALELLDSDEPRCAFGRGRRGSHAWRRTPFWLLPPSSAVLRSCSVGAAGPGAAWQVLMQGQLRSAGLAELLLSGSGAAWALAAEAAYAATATLASVNDGRQPPRLGLAGAVIAPAAGHDAAQDLLAAMDARSGSIAVSLGAAQLLSASVATAAEGQLAEQPAGQQQQQLRRREERRLALCGIDHCLPAEAACGTAFACVVAAAAHAAEQQHGLFLQPALLQASVQLQQLHLAQRKDLAASAGAPSGQPAGFGLLLPGKHQQGGCSFRSSRSAARQSSQGWQASACVKALRISQDGCSGGSLCMQGLQFQAAAARHKAANAPTACSRASYAAVWQAVLPCTAMPAAPGAPAGRLGRADALLRLGGSGRRCSRRSQALRRAVTCRLPQAAGWSADAGQTACLRTTQLLQVCAPRGQDSLSLTTAAPPAAATASPAAGSRWGSRAASAALHAVLRCAASEQPGAQFFAGSLCQAACGGGAVAGGQRAPLWDAPFGCHGQQLSAGTHLAAQLLPAAAGSRQGGRLGTLSGMLWAVSGGTGSLGLLAGGWLQQRQAASPVLLGRSGRLLPHPPQALLQAAGCILVLGKCDASMQADAAAAAVCLATAPLSGLLHAGGILRDAAVQQQTAATIRAVHAPKSTGLRCLLARPALAAPLQQCLLFSSIAAVTGPAGSSSYAAANAALDVAAEQLQSQGEPAGRRARTWWFQPSLLLLGLPFFTPCLLLLFL